MYVALVDMTQALGCSIPSSCLLFYLEPIFYFLLYFYSLSVFCSLSLIYLSVTLSLYIVSRLLECVCGWGSRVQYVNMKVKLRYESRGFVFVGCLRML